MQKHNSTYSMRSTLLLWLLVPLICLVTLSSVVANHFAVQFASQSFDSFLLNSADSIAARVRVNPSNVVLLDPNVSTRNLFCHGGLDKFYYQIVGEGGKILAGDGCLPSSQVSRDAMPVFAETSVEGAAVRFCSVPIDGQKEKMWVQAGETLNSRTNLLRELFFSILIPQVVLVILAAIVVWIGVGQGLKPLNRLGHALESRNRPDLSPVDIGKTPEELIPVLNSLNRLFYIADNYCRSQREFVANAAHQLRTPATALKTYIDHLSQNKDEAGTLLSQLAKASNRLSEMVNRLLVLARAESREKEHGQACDVVPVIGDAATSIIHQALNREIELQFDLPQTPLYACIGAADLMEICVNLLDNAVKYTPAKGSVWVAVDGTEDSVILTVSDSGPGIADLDKPRVFTRFFRSSENTETGCGLGLSIVRELCLNANASVELLDRSGGGSIFKLIFPRSINSKTVAETPHTNTTPKLIAANTNESRHHL